MSTAKYVEDSYLGDGVYASFDGYGIALDLRGQDNTTRIVLEPTVFDALVQYKARVDAYIAKAMATQAATEAVGG